MNERLEVLLYLFLYDLPSGFRLPRRMIDRSIDQILEAAFVGRNEGSELKRSELSW